MLFSITHSLYHALMALGSLVCHQAPERSPHLWHVQIPLCWRCSGILFGSLALVASTIVCRRLPPLRLSLAFALLMPLDVVGAIFGLWKGLNAARFITGTLWGVFGTSAILQLALRPKRNEPAPPNRPLELESQTSLPPFTPSN
ncbi:DUF2085 domain-containing protein [Pyrinomonas methylaliphatogenes]|uniref:Predicted membrane protein n=1 Tax=Pyrinomonas methylaliphatogenes TaxID=454194 RepID=A0A0B6WTY5_9BACT|nr:DUF2085 domain-containing protein [Pyrinomonas methylaliphatogenes]CDM64688.1 predicted membrane protein [Pyrinomonas methylaliphatogenes]